jgi:hypothetical protein
MQVLPATGRRRAALALLVAALAAGCGGDSSKDSELLSPASGRTLQGTLDEIERALNASECGLALQHATALAGRVESLPSRLAREARSALSASASRLEELVRERCERAPSPAGSQAAPQAVEEPGARGKKGKKPKKDEAPGDADLPAGSEAPPAPDETTPPGQDENPPPGQDQGPPASQRDGDGAPATGGASP